MKTRKKPVFTLHLGCGQDKTKGAIGVDINPDSAADILHNLNKFPYPFKTNQFDRVVADNIIEHLDNIVLVMEKIHRISKNGASIFIKTGHFSSVDRFTDPTHKHFFTSRTFDYFIPGTDLYKDRYSKAQFKMKHVSLGPVKTANTIVKILLYCINKYRLLYESRLAFIFPVGVISYELEVAKKNKKA